MKNANRGVARILSAAGYSWAGLRVCFKTEAAFREEVIVCLLLVPVALWLGDTGAERALLIGSLMLILIIELCNSALECVVDRIGEEYHVLSGRAKDIGSAAVLLSLLNAMFIWVLVVF